MRHVLLGIVTSLGLIAVGAGVAIASIPDSSGVVHACYKTSKPNVGSLIVIDSDAGQTCPSGYAPLSWNQTGTQGPAGPAGSSGYERVTTTAHLSYTTNSDNYRFVTGTCPTGKHATNAGLINISADQAWIDGVASNPSGVVHNGSVMVAQILAQNPGDSNYLRNPVPADSGQTPNAAGWTLALNVLSWPSIGSGQPYGMDINFWLACEIPSA
jgi:hypothetical protein